MSRSAASPGLEEPAPATTLVRYGEFAWLGSFTSRVPDLQLGEAVIVRTARGREWGEVLIAPEPALPEDPVDGSVLRRATELDRRRRHKYQSEELPEDYLFFTSAVERLALPLRLTAVDRPLGGERLVFYVEPTALIEDVVWGGLVASLRERYDLTVEIREVGETVRVKEEGCGSGGGCDREDCGSREPDEALAIAAPPVMSEPTLTLRPLPMAPS